MISLCESKLQSVSTFLCGYLWLWLTSQSLFGSIISPTSLDIQWKVINRSLIHAVHYIIHYPRSHFSMVSSWTTQGHNESMHSKNLNCNHNRAFPVWWMMHIVMPIKMEIFEQFLLCLACFQVACWVLAAILRSNLCGFCSFYCVQTSVGFF